MSRESSFEPETTRELAIYVKGRFDAQEALSASDRADLAKHLGMDEERFNALSKTLADDRKTALLEHDKTRDLIMTRDAAAVEDRATLRRHVESCDAANKRSAAVSARWMAVFGRALDVVGKLLVVLLTVYLGAKEGVHLVSGG